jgi:hypothetical protein
MGTANSYIGACATSLESPLMVAGVKTNTEIQKMGCISYLEMLEMAIGKAPASERQVLQALWQLVEMAGPLQLQRAAGVAAWYENRAPHIKIIEVEEAEDLKVSVRSRSRFAILREQRQEVIDPFLSVLVMMKATAPITERALIDTLYQLARLTSTESLKSAAMVAEMKASHSLMREKHTSAAPKNAPKLHKRAG